MSADSLRTVRTRNTATPQTKKAAFGQKKNAAGGFTFVLDDFARAKRFVILGASDGYYTTGTEFAESNTKAIRRVIDQGRSRDLVDYVVEVSLAGRAAKQQPGLFTLALASSFGTTEEKQYALSKLSAVARTATTLFEFVSYALQFRGWGRALKSAVANWYTYREVGNLAYQMVKYQSRAGWTHGDLIRVTHPKGSREFDNLAKWSRGREVDEVELPSIVQGFEQAKRSKSASDVLSVLDRFPGMTWEMVPNNLRSAEVWAELVRQGMPLGALLRQLPTLTRLGVLKPLSDEHKMVVKALSSQESIRKARLHPIQILLAVKVYASGGKFSRGSQSWSPDSQILGALDKAFYLAFDNVEATGKKFLLGVDVSPSMGSTINGSVLTSAEAVGALSLVWEKTEEQVHAVAFASADGRHGYGSPGVVPMNIGSAQRLDDVLRVMREFRYVWGGTDTSLPIQYALDNDLDVDVFITLTDNDTWAGNLHTHEALSEYRRRKNPEAKLIVLATSPSKFSIADPNDGGSLDIAGFDSAVPSVVREFVTGF